MGNEWLEVVPSGVWFAVGVFIGTYLREIRNKLDRVEEKVDSLDRRDDEPNR